MKNHITYYLFIFALLVCSFASAPSFSAEVKKTATKNSQKSTQKTSKNNTTSKKAANNKQPPKNKAEQATPEEKFIKEFNGWQLFKITDNSKKTCFITNSPTKESGTFKKRSQPYILVTHHGRGTPEVSVSSGYVYKEASDVVVQITGKDKANTASFDFFTSDKTPKVAWARDSKTDADVVNKMKAAENLTIKASSKANSTSEDIYSLKGFKPAFESMIKLCK